MSDRDRINYNSAKLYLLSGQPARKVEVSKTYKEIVKNVLAAKRASRSNERK